LPARQEEYVGRGYARHVTQIEVLPVAREWQPRRIAAPQKTNAWRNYVVTSLFGAVLGMTGYAVLVRGGGEKGHAVRAHTPAATAAAVANAVPQPAANPDDALHERLSTQLFNGDNPGAGTGYGNQPNRGNVPAPGMGYGNQQYRTDVSNAGAGYGARPQSSAGALLEQASNQLNRRDTAPRVQSLDAVPQQSDDALLQQAYFKFSLGDVLGARAAYETVAEHGSTLGAFGLAETYDPNVFARRRIVGIKPDPGLARLWYERAAKLGNLEASKRLLKLAKPARAVAAPRPAPSAKAASSGSEVLRR